MTSAEHAAQGGARISRRARTPPAGTADDVLVRLDDYVTASTPLTTITQDDMLEVDITMPAERASFYKGNQHTFTLSSPSRLTSLSDSLFSTICPSWSTT